MCRGALSLGSHWPSAESCWPPPAAGQVDTAGCVRIMEGATPADPDEALVSIGVPVFNGARFIGRALYSLLTQTYRNIDLIISDNASTDETAQICAHYARRDSRVRYIRQEHNIGAARNWNYVAKQARGRYFKWASANDWCDSRLIARCVAVLDAKPDVVLCYGRTCIVVDGKGLGAAYEHDFSLDEERPSDRFRRLRMVTRLNNAASGVARTEAIGHTRLIRMYPQGDLVFMAELALRGKFFLIDGDPLLFRNVAPGSHSVTMSAPALREFLTPGEVPRAHSEITVQRDYAAAVLRAPIGVFEKLRALEFVVRSVYWAECVARQSRCNDTTQSS